MDVVSRVHRDHVDGIRRTAGQLFVHVAEVAAEPLWREVVLAPEILRQHEERRRPPRAEPLPVLRRSLQVDGPAGAVLDIRSEPVHVARDRDRVDEHEAGDTGG